MAFQLDNLIIDRIQYGLATDFSDNPLYVLTQLSEATINTTAESTDAVDKNGTLIKRFWKAKSGEFTATNAMLNLSVIAAASGEAKELATNAHQIVIPKIVEVSGKLTETMLDGIDADSLDSVTVAGFGFNGSMTNAYKKGASATATDFVIASNGKLTLPTPATKEDKYLIKYYRKVNAGGRISNSADKFPRTVRLTLKALAVDPCSADTLRGVYIILPSFQVSPEIEISLTTDGKIDYKGAMQVDYCSENKGLYYIAWADADNEEV